MSLYGVVNAANRQIKELRAAINGVDTSITSLHSIVNSVDKTIFEYSKIGEVTGVDIRLNTSTSGAGYYRTRDKTGSSGSIGAILNLYYPTTKAQWNSYITLTANGNTIYASPNDCFCGFQVYFDLYLLTTKYPSGIGISDEKVNENGEKRLYFTFDMVSNVLGSGNAASLNKTMSTAGFYMSSTSSSYTTWQYDITQGSQSRSGVVSGVSPRESKQLYIASDAYSTTTSGSGVTLRRSVQVTFTKATWDDIEIPITLSI